MKVYGGVPCYVKIPVANKVAPWTIKFTYETHTSDLIVYVSFMHAVPSDKKWKLKKQMPSKIIMYSKEGTSEPFTEEFIYLALNSYRGIKVRLQISFPDFNKTRQKLGNLLFADLSTMSIKHITKENN